MAIEPAIQRLKDQPLPWDDLVQRRVLNEVHRAHRTKRDARRRRRVHTRIGLAAAALLVLGASVWGWSRLDAPPAAQPAVARSEGAAANLEAGQSLLSLADGSHALLEEGSVVDTQIQTRDLVRLSQEQGRVRYTVTPDPGRVFVVHAGAYQVRVLGTVFAVHVTTERLHVEVERGSVEVDRGDRTLVLGPGERIDLPRTLPRTLPQQDAARPAAPAAKDDVESDTPVGADASTTDASLPKTPALSAARLLERADTARRAGRLRDAAEALRTMVRTHKRDARAPSAWFMLGRVQRQRGQHEAAARAFQRAWKSASSDALVEDAHAEEALSWHEAGMDARASAAAKRYLQHYPAGTHRARVQAIVR